MDRALRPPGLPQGSNKLLLSGVLLGLAHPPFNLLFPSFVALVPYAASADVYFSPVKLFEYMSSGLPVVAARIGQTEKVIEHGRTGWLYAAGESDELAERIRWLSENRTAAEAAGAAAREQVLTHHTWRHNAMRVERIASRAIERRRAAVKAGRVGAEHAPPSPL